MDIFAHMMQVKRCFLLFVWYGSHLLVGYEQLSAQTTSFKGRYEAGLYLIKSESWGEAQQVFKELSLVAEDEKLSPYIQYFLAYANFRKGDLLQAQMAANMFNTQYQQWELATEAQFLKAEIEYARGRYTAAWQTLTSGVFNKEEKNAIEVLHHKYLGKAPQDTLNKLKQLHPENAILAEVIAQRKGSVSFAKNKPNLLNRTPLTLSKKDTIYVALILPLNLQDADVQKSASFNASVLDFYKGAHAAFQDMIADSFAIRLFVYDNKKQRNELKRLLELKEMRLMDLVIGPGFADGLEPMRLFSIKHKVLVINPLNTPTVSQNGDGQFFSLIPSNETAAAMAFNTIKPFSPGKKCAIVYGVQRRDSLFAHAYKKEAEQAGFQIPVFKNVGKNSAANLSKFLLPMMDDTLGHIMIPNDVDLVRTQALAAVDYLKLRQPVFIFSDWLDQPNADFEAFNNRRIYFLDQDYHDRYTDKAKVFAKRFTTQNGLAPTYFAWRGYEVMQVFAKLAIEKGTDKASFLKSGIKMNGYFSPGFQFNNKGENIYCPVLQLKNLSIADLNQTPTTE